MQITDITTLPIGKNPHNVDARVAYDTDNAVVVAITLQPGEELKKHLTPDDVFFYVLEGTGVVEIGDETEEVGPNMLVESPAKIPHRWFNRSDSVFRVLVVKVPKPTTGTQIL